MKKRTNFVELKIFIININNYIFFSKWSRKAYAIFSSLGRVIHISNIDIKIQYASLKKLQDFCYDFVMDFFFIILTITLLKNNENTISLTINEEKSENINYKSSSIKAFNLN